MSGTAALFLNDFFLTPLGTVRGLDRSRFACGSLETGHGQGRGLMRFADEVVLKWKIGTRRLAQRIDRRDRG